MPSYRELSQKHPTYDLKTWRLWRALYAGGDALKSVCRELLPRLTNEGDRPYEDRIGRAPGAYSGLVPQAINMRRDQLFSAPFRVTAEGREDLPEFFLQLLSACDVLGSDFTSFMKEVHTDADIVRKSYVAVRFPSEGEEPAQTVAQVRSRKLDEASLELVSRENVINWEVDAKGQLIWAMLHKMRAEQADPFKAPEVVETFELMTRIDTQTFEFRYAVDKSPSDSDQPSKTFPVERNRFGAVLLFPYDLGSRALMPKAYLKEIRHWELFSALQFATLNTSIPAFVMKAENPDDIQKGDPSNIRCGIVIGPKDDLSILTPETGSFEFQLKQLSEIEDQIYQLCDASISSRKEPSDRARSSETRKLDATLNENALKTLAPYALRLADALLTTIARCRSESELFFSVSGLDSYTISMKGIELDEADRLLAMNLGNTANQEIKFLLVGKYLASSPETILQKIKREIQEAPEAAPAPVVSEEPAEAPQAP